MSKKTTFKRSETDWKRVDRTTDNEIDYSDAPPMDAGDFARGIVRKGLKSSPSKSMLTIRVDNDVLDWYRSLGAGYQTKINALLRAYMEANQSG